MCAGAKGITGCCFRATASDVGVRPESLAILEVNEAATQHYGYSREDFWDDAVRFAGEGGSGAGTGYGRRYQAQGLVWRHRRKNGGEMDMEVIWSPLAFHGKLRR